MPTPKRPMFSLEDKAIVVTGGGRGIGRGITLAMAQAGAKGVVITGRKAEALEKTAEEARAFGAKVVTVPSDITKAEDIARIVDVTMSEFGYIDGWVNNAGSADPVDVSDLMNMSESQWDHVVDLNLKWTFFCAQAAARTMTRGGSIVNISSRSGSQPCPMTGQYGAAKAGVESLTATAAVEWGHLGIRVNAIAPGVVPTERDDGSMLNQSRRRRQIETVPLRRLGKVEDIGPLAVYFVSDESSWITGTVVQATGGSRIPVGLLTYLWRKNKEAEERETAGA